MFLATDHSKQVVSDLPRNCSFSESDWHVLAGFWHPVAFSHTITDEPVSARLLDVDLVIYRTDTGVSVAKDLCMHRGTKLSMGKVCNNRLVCPMHGLEFDSKGACKRIPSMGDEARIPDKLALQSYQVQERYDLVWVCLKDEAIWPLPEWPELEQESSEFEKVLIPEAHLWEATASRQTENFIDVAHHPFVHTKTFGNPGRPVIPLHTIEQTERGLKLNFTRYELERGWHDPEHTGERLTDYVYDLTFPFAKDLYTEGKEDGIKCHFYDVAVPVSANQTRIFQLNLTNNLYCSKEEYPEYQLVTNEEDRVCVETQHPEEVPLDLREEIHIPADRFSLEYRKALVEKFGLGAPISS